MKFVENMQDDFVNLNTKIEGIIEFYECIIDDKSELKDYVELLLEKTLIGYKTYLHKNNISLDMVPESIKEYMQKEKSYVKA